MSLWEDGTKEKIPFSSGLILFSVVAFEVQPQLIIALLVKSYWHKL
jgi:hypothetical protein